MISGETLRCCRDFLASNLATFEHRLIRKSDNHPLKHVCLDYKDVFGGVSW